MKETKLLKKEKKPKIKKPRVDETLSKRGRRELRKAKAVSAAFLAPSLIGVLVFFILPFIVIIYYSLINNPVQREFVGLDNFIKLFQNYSFKTAAYNTLRFSLVSVPLAVILSLLLAMGLNCKIPMQSKLRSFFLSPMMVPVASIVLIWQVLFHYNGTVNGFLAQFGIEKIDWMKSPEGIWAAEHCAEYGFIIRYPKGKTNITGYIYEPWHLRYVGKEAAQEITEMGVTFEEYIATVRSERIQWLQEETQYDDQNP